MTADLSTRIVPVDATTRPACVRLWVACQREILPLRGDDEAAFVAKTAGEELFVALVDGHVSGLLSLWRPDQFIHYLMVDGACRRLGIGTLLLRFAIQALGPPVDLKCALDNHAARHFYDRHNGTVVAQGDSPDGAYMRYRFEHA